MNCELPSIDLLIRAVKTIARGFFRGHLHETDSVFVIIGFGYAHSLNGTVVSSALMDRAYDSLCKSAIAFVPNEASYKDKIKFSGIEKCGTLSLQNVVTYYRETLQGVGFPDQLTGTLSDIWGNAAFKKVYL